MACGTAVSQTLKQAYRDYWRTSVSVNQWQVETERVGTPAFDITGRVSSDQTADWPVIVENFDWVVAENCMKCEVIHPKTCRPADLLEPELEKLRAEIPEWIEQPEDVLTYAQFPEVAPKFFKARRDKKIGINPDADIKNKVHPV